MNAPAASPHRKLLVRLLAVVAASFAFGFALVPLYDVFCELTGLNGRTSRSGGFTLGGIASAPAPAAAPSRIDGDRVVTVEFTSTVMPGLPWRIEAITPRLDLHPGELQQASFRVVNLSDRKVTGQAIPSVTPGQAARHFAKLDCFCFAQQEFGPGESRELTVTFIVQPELDADVRTITLAYALFNTAAPAKVARSDPPP